MAVRLTAPHPLHGNPGDLVELDDDPQAERDLVSAGYAVDAYKAPGADKGRKAGKDGE